MPGRAKVKGYLSPARHLVLALSHFNGVDVFRQDGLIRFMNECSSVDAIAT